MTMSVLLHFTNGIFRLKLDIIFHGTLGGRIFDLEKYLYSPNVNVFFNETAYNNENLF